MGHDPSFSRKPVTSAAGHHGGVTRGTPRRIAELKRNARKHLKTFTNPKLHYAFRTYDQADVHQGKLTAADVLMANLLSLRLGWTDVIPLFAAGNTPFTKLRQALDEALDECRSLPDLERCTDDELAMPALARANELATDVSNWSNVTVSKVLHRLAPVVPVIDSSVRAFFHTTQPYRIRFRLCEELRENETWLRPLADLYPRGEDRPLSLTRAADILIWMDSKSS